MKRAGPNTPVSKAWKKNSPALPSLGKRTASPGTVKKKQSEPVRSRVAASPTENGLATGSRPSAIADPRRNLALTSRPVVCFISLGCDKNTVDTERLMASLVQDGFLIAERPEDSDLALVNTCGFIADAREESEQTLRALAAGRRRGRPRRIVALGCLVERLRASDGLAAHLPADVAIGFADYPRIGEICRALLAETPAFLPRSGENVEMRAKAFDAFQRGPRLLTGPPHLAALKISEGCSNRCRYCAIPLIRGPHVSRPIKDLVAETRQLVDCGAREIAIVGQDTTAYGTDLYGEPSLPRLLRALAEIEGPARFRLMYAHPRRVSDELLATLRDNTCFLPYLDLPLQHINDRVLRAMGRGLTGVDVRRTVEHIRAAWPAVALRTSYIVGFPGETEAEFEELLRWVEEGAFLYAGVFAYSSEPGTPAGAEPDDVPPAEKERRRAALMETQRAVSRHRLRAERGKTIEITVDERAERGERFPHGAVAIGRAPWQAPEVDGVVYLRSRRPPSLGEIIRARVVETLDYDLVAVAEETPA